MKVTITEQHLDAAIAARLLPKPKPFMCHSCIVAQSLKPIPDFDFYSFGRAHFVDGKLLRAGKGTMQIEGMFDELQYDRIRALLPYEAEFREGVA